MLKLLNFPYIACKLFEFRILIERLSHHLLNIYVLIIVQIKNNLICNFKFACQVLARIVHHPDHLFRLRKIAWVFSNYYDVSFLIKSSSACSSRHLHVFRTVQKTMTSLASRWLFNCMKNNSFCRHIYTHRKRLSRKQNFYKTLTEKQFYNFFSDR